MRSIGIDIGSSSIKLVEIKMTSKGASVVRILHQNIGRNAGLDPEFEILEFLRNVEEKMDLTACKVVIGMRQDQVSVRNKVFPFNDRLKIIKSLPFELEEDIPFSIETAVYDCKMVRQKANMAEVLACTSPKHRILETLKRAEDVHLDIDLLSAEGIALSNCWENWNDPVPEGDIQMADSDISSRPERKMQLLLHIGHTRTVVLAMENNSLIGVRSILWGTKMVAEAISKKYELPMIEAIKEMETKAFILNNKENSSYDQIVFSDTIANEVKVLSKEIKLTILEFQTEFNGPVQAVGITGGGSQIINLHAFLTQQLEVPVNLKKSLALFTHNEIEITPQADAVIGIALGLAVEGLKKPRNPALNFLKGEFIKRNTQLAEFWLTWKVPIQAAATCFLTFFVYASMRSSISESLNEKTTDAVKIQAKTVAKLPSKKANKEGIREFIKTQASRAKSIQDLQRVTQMNSALDILKKVTDALPSKNMVTVNVRSFKVKDETVEIEGTVAKSEEVNLLQKALGNLASDGKVQVVRSAKVTGPGIPFAYSFKVDRGMRSN